MKYSSTFFLVFFGAKRAARKEGEEYQNLEWLNLTIVIFTGGTPHEGSRQASKRAIT